MSQGFVILTSTSKPWYQSGNISQFALEAAPVGKGGNEKKTPAKNRASARGAPTIEYPIFKQAAELTADPFWQSVFNNMALGTFPRSSKYVNNMLTYKIKSKTYNVTVDQENPASALEDVSFFLRTKAKMLSPTDKLILSSQAKEQLARATEIEIDSWAKIRTVEHRKQLISRYVRDVAADLRLNEADIKRLEAYIVMGCTAGHFGPHNITVEGGVISNIKGYKWTECGPKPETGYAFKMKKPAKSRRTTKVKEEVTDTSTSQGDDEQEQCGVKNKTSLYKSWLKLLTKLDKSSSKRNGIKTLARTAQPSVEPDTEMVHTE